MPERARLVLIIAPGDDIHALSVADRISAIYGSLVECRIFDTATYPLRSGLDVEVGGRALSLILRPSQPLARTLGPRTGRFLLNQALPSGKPIPLDASTSVWLRRYRRPVLHPDVTEPEFQDFCSEVLQSTLYSALERCRVYNSIKDEDHADFKTHQLVLAQESGLDVPRTLITNDLDKVEEFVRRIEREGKRVLYKHASAVAAFGMPTRVVDAAARERFGSLIYAPTIFQEEITGGLDLRFAVVGAKIFCCEWRGTSSNRRFADVKLEDGLKMWPGAVPAKLRASLLSVHCKLGLTFGIYDFKTDKNGTPFFLEVNPSGQWLDMEIEGGQPISESVARVLVEGSDIAPSEQLRPFMIGDLDRIASRTTRPEALNWNPVG